MRVQKQIKEYKYRNANHWTEQEKECYKCKRSTGCNDCSIVKDYQIETCNIFKHVLIKFAKLGQPKGV